VKNKKERYNFLIDVQVNHLNFDEQAIKLEKEIVDDRIVKVSGRRVIGNDVADGYEDVEEDDVDKVLSVSRTRSGRMSRPPTQHDDDYQYRMPPASMTQNQASDVIKDVTPEVKAELQAPTPRPKRKLSVPPRYRCRVCHKTYLGNFIFIFT